MDFRNRATKAILVQLASSSPSSEDGGQIYSIPFSGALCVWLLMVLEVRAEGGDVADLLLLLVFRYQCVSFGLYALIMMLRKTWCCVAV